MIAPDSDCQGWECDRNYISATSPPHPTVSVSGVLGRLSRFWFLTSRWPLEDSTLWLLPNLTIFNWTKSCIFHDITKYIQQKAYMFFVVLKLECYLIERFLGRTSTFVSSSFFVSSALNPTSGMLSSIWWQWVIVVVDDKNLEAQYPSLD